MAKSEPLLISYIACDLLSKSDQIVVHKARIKIIAEM